VPPPDALHVATYRRRVAASEVRVWENVRDWEHLPWLHAASFRSIALEDEGAWGWRARIGLHGGAEIRLELVIDAAASRYVSRTIEGAGAGSEIWTTVTPAGDAATDVAVAFWLPGITPAHADAIGAAYVQLYERLWDEDESMMVRRTDELARPPRDAARAAPILLGTLADVRARLPFCFDLAGERWRLVEIEGALYAHATRCPHALGPLDEAPLEAGTITCPWHGWRFDVTTGKAQDARRARLPEAPRIHVDEASNVTATPPARQ
jgi:nitrite reductase/ring-hydroxylating ferredoxin subunit